jgi:hypothetical protein
VLTICLIGEDKKILGLTCYGVKTKELDISKMVFVV